MPNEEPLHPGRRDGTIRVSDAVTEGPGSTIGNYKLLEQIGEGGFGVVYVAEQREPLRRRIALKVIKLGMDTKQVVARFEAERQALALMDSPNIARVYDAGTTEAGRPFFVMELVHGIKITSYCDQNHLPTGERLRLFIEACHAVQHAHQKGIIHRDLKPSNILVSVEKERPVPKVIDFGIAKATQGNLTEKTIYTELFQLMGTPAYMSPEQAEMSGLDIDTRADIYSLGVVLYELLTGDTPFDSRQLSIGGVESIRRTIRDQEPPRPSNRLTALAPEDLTTVARNRGTEPPRLMSLLRGDLDWIVMKAIEKDRTRRYESADALASDVQRHLNNEPVMARPPSTTYRLQKLVRRNKSVFGATVLIAIVLMFAVGFSGWQAVRARNAEREQRRLREESERTTAELLRTRADVFGRSGEWNKAAADLLTVVKLDGTNHWDWFRLAALMVKTGQREQFEKVRHSMLEQFARTTEAKIADRVSKGSLLLPGDPEVVARAQVLAERAVLLGEKGKEEFLPYYQLTAALAAYRAGDLKTARELVAKALSEEDLDVNIQALARVQLAMIEYRVGDAVKARTTLTEARRLSEKLVKTSVGNLEQNYWQNWWHDWLILQILLEEAAATIR